jgi:hypothetical protein
MQMRLLGTQHEVNAMAEWLPSLFCVVEFVHVYQDQDGPLYRLDADVHCVPQGTP